MKKRIIILLICILSMLSVNVYAEDVIVLESQLVAKNAEISGIETAIEELEKGKRNLKTVF